MTPIFARGWDGLLTRSTTAPVSAVSKRGHPPGDGAGGRRGGDAEFHRRRLLSDKKKENKWEIYCSHSHDGPSCLFVSLCVLMRNTCFIRNPCRLSRSHTAVTPTLRWRFAPAELFIYFPSCAFSSRARKRVCGFESLFHLGKNKEGGDRTEKKVAVDACRVGHPATQACWAAQPILRSAGVPTRSMTG